MKTEKRLILFLILSAGILLISRSFMPPVTPLTQPSVNQQPINSTTVQPTGPEVIPVVPEAQQKQAVLGDFTVNYSETGGYINSIYLNNYSERLPVENILYTPELATALFSVEQTNDSLTFTYDTPAGVVIKEFSFIEPYGLEIKLLGMEKFSDVVMFEQPEDASGPSTRYQELVYRTDSLHKKLSTTVNKPLHLSNLEYIGMRGRYYAAAVINPEGTYTVNRIDHRLRLVKQEFSEGSTRIFLGPQTSDALAQYNLEDMVSYGLLTPIVLALKAVLGFFARMFNNWGISIILLAVVVYGICFPLTAKSTKSMRRMQEFQPHFEALREKHKDDPQRLQKEMIELYRKYQINPMSGCLPLLLQMPIFIALYQLMFRLPELQGANFLWINDLSRPDYLITLPVSLPLVGDGVHLLPVIMGVLTFLQQKFTTKTANMTEQQQMMLWLMPIMLLFIFYRFPAALVLYWMTNSLLTFSYQLYLSRTSN